MKRKILATLIMITPLSVYTMDNKSFEQSGNNSLIQMIPENAVESLKQENQVERANLENENSVEPENQIKRKEELVKKPKTAHKNKSRTERYPIRSRISSEAKSDNNKKNIDEVRTERRNQEERVTATEERLDKTEININNHNEQLESLNNDTNSIKKVLNEVDKKASGAENELREIKYDLDVRTEKWHIKQSLVNNEEARENKENLNAKLSGFEKKLNDAKEQINKINQKLTLLTKQQEEMATQNKENLNTELSGLREKFNDTKECINNSNAEVARLITQQKAAENRLDSFVRNATILGIGTIAISTPLIIHYLLSLFGA